MHRRTAARALMALWLSTACPPARVATAAPPTLGAVEPRGLERGKTVAFTLSGEGVGGAGAEVRTSLPGTIGPVEVVGPNQIKVAVTVPGDAPVGYYTVRARTADGLTAPLAVAVGDLPELTEAEPNDGPDSAQKVDLPVTLNGSSAGTDRDFVRFEAKKGQAVVLEVEARRIGSGLDPALTVLDASGRTLTTAADASPLDGDTRLVFVPPADGTYLAVLNDVAFRGASNPYYRWKIGNYAAADALFPLGWTRGEPVDLQWLGGNLPGPVRLRVEAPADPEAVSAAVQLPASGPLGSAPHRLILSDLPEALEPEGRGPHPLAVGAVMNGRLAEAGEVDTFRLPARPGQVFSLEVDAARLGSRLDGVLTARKADGSTLAEADDGNGLDPALRLTVPEGVDEILVSVSDLLGRGGPGFAYRLTARPPAADFELKVAAPSITIPRGAPTAVPVRVARRDFDGPIQLSISGDLARAGITAAGGRIAAGAEEGILLLSASADAEPRVLPLEIWGSGGPDPQPIRRRARLTTDGTPGGPDRPFTLAAAVGNGPPFLPTASADSIALVHGQKTTLVVRANRPEGNKEPITIATAGLPPQVSGGAATIGPDQTEATLEFETAALAPLASTTLSLSAKFKAGGRDEAVLLPPIAARVSPAFSVEVLTPEIKAAPGTRAVLTAIVRRAAPFAGPVHLAVEGSVSPQVIILPAEVPAGSALAQIEVTLGPAAPAETYDLLVRATADMAGRKQTKDYQIADIPVRLTVAPAGAATPVASQ